MVSSSPLLCLRDDHVSSTVLKRWSPALLWHLLICSVPYEASVIQHIFNHLVSTADDETEVLWVLFNKTVMAGEAREPGPKSRHN